MRGVFERVKGSGVWWINYYVNGQQHREKVGRHDVAVEAYYRRKVEIREGRFMPPRGVPDTLTFGELLDQAADDRQYRLAASSVESDKQRARILKGWFGSVPAGKITVAMVSARLKELRERGRSGATANRYCAYLSAIFSWGIKQGKVGTNPAKQVDKYRESDSGVRFLSQDEESALRKVIRKDYPEEEPELDVALHCGLRRNELYRLKWDGVDLERLILTVKGKKHANSTASSERHIPIDSVAARAFAELRRCQGSVYVCPGRQKGTETDRDWERWFERSIRKAGIVNFRYHDLRHTFASRLVMLGVPLATVMKWMGHRSIAMTMRYAHLAPFHEQTNIELLARNYPASSDASAKNVVKMGTNRHQNRHQPIVQQFKL